MKILSLQAENVKKLRAIEIKPDGSIVTITGRNGAGKTSVLDSIWWALAGTSSIQAQPIRKGEKKAHIRLNLGTLTVERRFTEKGSSLIVENEKGARFTSPQAMLDGLLGALSFDPLAFARMSPRDQRDQLRGIAKVDADIDALDGLNRADFGRRTDINRDAKMKKAQAEAIVILEGLPEEQVDETALLDSIQKAGETNADIAMRSGNRAAARAKIEHIGTNEIPAKRAAIQALQVQIKRLEGDIAVRNDSIIALTDQQNELQAKLDTAPPLPKPVDIADLRAELNQAQIVNRSIAKRGERQRIEGEVAALEQQAAELTSTVEARERAKAEAIAAAEMPVPGLGFGEDCVLFSGIPLEQASSAEQLKISLAIAMANNPELRVIRIQDGSLLDEDSLATIQAMATDKDHQVRIERVDTSGKIGIVIEDGMVKAVNASKK